MDTGETPSKNGDQTPAERKQRFVLPREINHDQLRETADSLLDALRETVPPGVLVVDVSDTNAEDTVLLRLAAGLLQSADQMNISVILEPESAVSESPWRLFGDWRGKNIDRAEN